MLLICSWVKDSRDIQPKTARNFDIIDMQGNKVETITGKIPREAALKAAKRGILRGESPGGKICYCPIRDAWNLEVQRQ